MSKQLYFGAHSYHYNGTYLNLRLDNALQWLSRMIDQYIVVVVPLQKSPRAAIATLFKPPPPFAAACCGGANTTFLPRTCSFTACLRAFYAVSLLSKYVLLPLPSVDCLYILQVIPSRRAAIVDGAQKIFHCVRKYQVLAQVFCL